MSIEKEVLVLDYEKFDKLCKGEKIYIKKKPLKHGHNFFTSHITDLALRKTVDIPNYHKQIKLDETISFIEIYKTLNCSPLNRVYSLMPIFVVKYDLCNDYAPKVEKEIMKVLKKSYER